MATIKKSLRKTLSVFIQFITGREENSEEKVIPTQRNQHFT